MLYIYNHVVYQNSLGEKKDSKLSVSPRIFSSSGAEVRVFCFAPLEDT